MAKLVIGSWGTTREMAGMSPEGLRHAGSQGQRMLWCAEAGDVIVLPIHPDPAFLSYATGLMGFDAASVDVVVPPPGRGGEVLTRDRVEDAAFLAELRDRVRDRGADSVTTFYFDDPVNWLVRQVGLDKGTAGFGFVDQGGNELLNSKVVFRMLAAGTSLPVPDGIVTETAADAVDFVWELLRSGRSAIVKQDTGSAGAGNEILTPAAGVDAIGAEHHFVFTDRAALAEHVASRWLWYTEQDRRPAVLEEYIPDCDPIWGEAEITDDSVRLLGHGRIRLRPICEGVIIPVPPEARTEPFHAFLGHLEALATTLQGIGYRGMVNIDAILTPDGRTLFNELNGRWGGSTHLFTIGERIVGGGYLEDRCLVERRGNSFASFSSAQQTLVDNGLAYDPATRTGVIITVYGTRPDGTGGEACIIGENLEAAERMERTLQELFPD
jgi:pre ATP-grasp domain-containing protein/pheganomycin biosynthesis PGM1-like protein